MKYVTNREKIIEYIDTYIKPALIKKDLNYDKVILGISRDLSMSQNTVKEVLDNQINMGILVRENILTLSKEDIPKFYEYLNKKEETIKQADKEMEKIESLIKKDE